jgi:hypothetical protein
MFRYFNFYVLLLLSSLISGTINGQDLHSGQEGVIVFRDSSVLVGEVQLNFQHNILQYKTSGALRSIHASQILQVNLHDADLGCIRQFISVPFGDGFNMSDQFFEVIINGHIQIVIRDRFPGNNHFFTSNRLIEFSENQASEFIKSMDFFLFDGKNLIPMHSFKKRALPAFYGFFEEEMKQFIKRERINPNLRPDQIKVVKHFNKLYAESTFITKR